MSEQNRATAFRGMLINSRESKRPWQPDDGRVRIPHDSDVWLDPDREVEFSVQPGMSMAWTMRGPGVTLSTNSLDHANRSAQAEADRWNTDHPGRASVSLWEHG